MKYLKTLVFISFLIGNVAYQFLVPDTPSLAVAFERSFFQGAILIWLFILEKL